MKPSTITLCALPYWRNSRDGNIDYCDFRSLEVSWIPELKTPVNCPSAVIKPAPSGTNEENIPLGWLDYFKKAYCDICGFGREHIVWLYMSHSFTKLHTQLTAQFKGFRLKYFCSASSAKMTLSDVFLRLNVDHPVTLRCVCRKCFFIRIKGAALDDSVALLRVKRAWSLMQGRNNNTNNNGNKKHDENKKAPSLCWHWQRTSPHRGSSEGGSLAAPYASL